MAALSTYSHVSTLAGTERVPVVVTPGVVGGNAYITADEQAASAPFSSRYVPIAGGVALTDAAQTITTSTTTDITWGTEVSDPDGWTAGGIATLTVPAGKAGRYLISYTGVWSANPVTAFAALIINGTLVTSVPQETLAFGTGVTVLRTLAVADTVVIRVHQASGSNKDIVSRLEICQV